jgi:glycosyltransferase involved in cell wall biosynthesis
LTQSTLILVIRKNIGDNISLQAPKLKRKIRLIPHGVDTLTIDRISNHSLDPTKNSVTISFVGRLSPENFVYDIVLLGAMLRDIGLISFEILIVGDGPLKDELATKIKRANLHDKIKLVGFLGFEEVIKIRKRSISFVPMGGMSLLEAMASKSATIAYDIDWHNEIIESGVNGYLVSQADLASAAKLVVALAQEPSARVIVGDRAHRTITEGYSRISSINHKIAHYKEILSLKNEN